MEAATMMIACLASLLLGACSTWAVMTEELRYLRARVSKAEAAERRVAERASA